jgi:hypothetical protein|tara:strand:- start:220 stop:342 length:123 start_codon:yes stop_codon:yes gene_type:complete
MKLDLNNIINTKVLLIALSLTIFIKYVTDKNIEENIVIKM